MPIRELKETHPPQTLELHLFCFSAEVMFAHFCGVWRRKLQDSPCRSYQSESSVFSHSYGGAQFCFVGCKEKYDVILIAHTIIKIYSP